MPAGLLQASAGSNSGPSIYIFSCIIAYYMYLPVDQKKQYIDSLPPYFLLRSHDTTSVAGQRLTGCTTDGENTSQDDVGHCSTNFRPTGG